MKQKSSILDTILNVLRERVVKLALKKILGSAAMGGFKAWAIAFIVENLWDEIAEPVIKAGLVELKYIKDKIDGKITIKKIEEARESGSDEDYDNAVDDLYN